jgi:hypothetical protein
MARYKDAIFWIVGNDCTEFLDDETALSITASFAADMFGKSDAEIRADLTKERARQGRPVGENPNG